MREICLPLSGFLTDQPAEVIIKNKKNNKKLKFRLEVFDFMTEKSFFSETIHEEGIRKLRKFINNYDKNWELIQLFSDDSKRQVYALFKCK